MEEGQGEHRLALALISSGAPLLVAAFTLVAMNLRHLLYGPALIKRVGKAASTRHAWAWAFGLTDEVFGAALGAMARGRVGYSEPFMFGLTGGAYAAWLSGTALGAYAGGAALANWPVLAAALGFMLPALFLALLLVDPVTGAIAGDCGGGGSDGAGDAGVVGYGGEFWRG
ncbi:MAG: AzlC family ABC transporter permease [Cypionkella sp.]